MSRRAERIREELMHLAARFLEEESDRTAMITVTNVLLSPHLTHVTILFTVYPEEKEEVMLKFAEARQHKFRHYVTEHSRIGGFLPQVSFGVDGGEKNRQRIDKLSKK